MQRDALISGLQLHRMRTDIGNESTNARSELQKRRWKAVGEQFNKILEKCYDDLELRGTMRKPQNIPESEKWFLPEEAGKLYLQLNTYIALSEDPKPIGRL